LAKPDWQLKRRDRDRDRDRGPGRARDFREPMRDDVVLHLASNNRRANGPRQDNSKPQLPKQGVNGALRAANLRLLLEKTPVREALALVAEVPLERLEAMSQGALCPDETAFHIERALKLPGKWLDGLNKEVPERTLELLKHPDTAALHDDDFDEETPTSPAVVAAAPVEAPHAAARPAAQASKAAIATAAVQPRSSAAAPRSKSDPKAPSPMPSPELRQKNLSILVQAKGAKSALARLIGISQPYMSTIANGGKVLDQEFCRNVAQTLGMPDDWFEAPRTAADIPAAVLQRLVPLPRGAAASADAASPNDTAQAQTTPAGTNGETTPGAAIAPAASSEPATAVTDPDEEHVLTTSAPRKVSAPKKKPSRIPGASQRDSQQRSEPSGQPKELVGAPDTAPAQADLLSQIETESQPAAQEATLPEPAEVIAAPARALDIAPVTAAASASAHQATQRTSDLVPASAQPLIVEAGLEPITEALIKILVLKARQGALSEDKAFELLGAIRLL
jgi:transcriptional regulator with XRE-family HTH domain